jgi:dipeptidase E
MRLFLYSSYVLSAEHRSALERLVDKPPEDITFAAIQNAADVEDDAQDWVEQSRRSIARDEAQIEVVDLRDWLDGHAGLLDRLACKDVIWVCGGNGFYLRWILKASGADAVIRRLASRGTVYAGWSAGAVVAGPTLQYFEPLEDLTVVPELHHDGLGLTDAVVLPHMDLEAFGEGMRTARSQLEPAGFRCVPLTEAEAFVVDGDQQRVIPSEGGPA